MSDTKTYSVSELSRLAGISVRTLHHYDEIDLLKPRRNPQNGYREYQHSDLILLQQILIYRELDFSTRNIKDLLHKKEHDLLNTLYSQRALLVNRQSNLQKMIDNLDASVRSIKSKAHSAVLYEGIPTDKAEDWEDLVTSRYGENYLDEGLLNLGMLEGSEVRKLKELSRSIGEKVAENLGKSVQSKEMQSIVTKQIDWIRNLLTLTNTQYSEVTFSVVMKFATSLIEVPAFAALYEVYGAGTAKHLSEAMMFYAEQHLSNGQDV